MRFFHIIGTILWKDILLEWRSKQILSSVFVFALLTLVIFNFALGENTYRLQETGPGILWVALIFAGILSLNRSFNLEKEGMCLQGMFLTPIDGGYIYLGKMLGNFLFITLVEMILIPIFMVFFNYSIIQILPSLFLFLILGTPGFSAAGTVFAALSINTKAAEVILPVLLLPILVPLLIAAVKGTIGVMQGTPLAELIGWINLLVAFDIILCAVSFVVFEYTLEE